MLSDFQSINKAFSRQSGNYDSYDFSNPVLQWMRERVRKHVNLFLKKNDRMLELNAGTGLDALYFIEQGCSVYATDLSDGMIKQLLKKAEENKLTDKLKVKQCSYTDLQNLGGEKFDYIFSNFGGLNCIPDLKEVTHHIPALLKPYGYVTFVIMPPVCPWEMIGIMKGNKSAFRRLSKNGAMAHLEGEYFRTYYFSPSQVVKSFGEDFTMIRLEGLGSLSPTPQSEKFPVKYPRLYKLLTAIDEKISLMPPFRSWADHFILTVQYVPKR